MSIKAKARIAELEDQVSRLRAENILLERRAERAEAAGQKPDVQPPVARRGPVRKRKEQP